MGQLKLVKEGKIGGWVWLALFSLTYLALLIGIMFSDGIAKRVSMCQVIVTAGLPTVLGSYAYSKKDALTERAKCSPKTGDEP